ncbi:hypothetical protein HA402_000775 [Bradysia odoriphaga]|nr:hypothetical protein HA402_000775 [Bradysia odoriphaga]
MVKETTSQRGQFTYQVSITTSDYEHCCFGALLSDRWILSSATCVVSITFFDLSDVTLTVGGYNVREGCSYMSDYMKIHENFNAITLENDIALYRTDRPITFNQDIQPIPYFKGNMPATISDTVVIGWGEDGSRSNPYLVFASMTVLANSGCATVWKKENFPNGLNPSLVPSTAFCASYNGSLWAESRLCPSEPSLPLSTQGRVLIGIQAGFSGNIDNCGTSTQPSLFTQTARLANWILNVTNIDGVYTL